MRPPTPRTMLFHVKQDTTVRHSCSVFAPCLLAGDFAFVLCTRNPDAFSQCPGALVMVLMGADALESRSARLIYKCRVHAGCLGSMGPDLAVGIP